MSRQEKPFRERFFFPTVALSLVSGNWYVESQRLFLINKLINEISKRYIYYHVVIW